MYVLGFFFFLIQKASLLRKNYIWCLLPRTHQLVDDESLLFLIHKAGVFKNSLAEAYYDLDMASENAYILGLLMQIIA